MVPIKLNQRVKTKTQKVHLHIRRQPFFAMKIKGRCLILIRFLDFSKGKGFNMNKNRTKKKIIQAFRKFPHKKAIITRKQCWDN
jgi:uncharacterized protein (DUF924 family)